MINSFSVNYGLSLSIYTFGFVDPITFNPFNLKSFMFVDVFTSLSTHYRLEDAVSYDLESYISDTTSIGHSELSSDVQSQATIEMLDSQETNITTTVAPVTSTTTTTTAQQALTPNQDTLETAPSNIVQISPPPIPEITALENVTATEDPLQPSPENEFNQWHEEGGEVNITESRNEGDQLRAMTDLESPEQDWQDDESHTSDDNWQDEFSPPMIDMPEFAQRTNEFIPSDDDNVYSMELRELLSRYVFCLRFMFYFIFD